MMAPGMGPLARAVYVMQVQRLPWAGVFATLAAGFAGFVVTEPITQFLIISTISTVALVGAAAAVSALWFRVVLKNNGLRLRFAAAA